MMIIRLLLATFLVVALFGPHIGVLFLVLATMLGLIIWVVKPGG